jgi:hypothetical protein
VISPAPAADDDEEGSDGEKEAREIVSQVPGIVPSSSTPKKTPSEVDEDYYKTLDTSMFDSLGKSRVSVFIIPFFFFFFNFSNQFCECTSAGS